MCISQVFAHGPADAAFSLVERNFLKCQSSARNLLKFTIHLRLSCNKTQFIFHVGQGRQARLPKIDIVSLRQRFSDNLLFWAVRDLGIVLDGRISPGLIHFADIMRT